MDASFYLICFLALSVCAAALGVIALPFLFAGWMAKKAVETTSTAVSKIRR